MNRSTPGLPVHHQLPKFTQTHVHRVSDAIQPSHPPSSPSLMRSQKGHVILWLLNKGLSLRSDFAVIFTFSLEPFFFMYILYLHFLFIGSVANNPGEGSGTPLQCSCLENPTDGGAWWAAVHGSHRVGHDWATQQQQQQQQQLTWTYAVLPVLPLPSPLASFLLSLLMRL